ncbi:MULTISPECIES: SipW-dependent-type signal peptide-containing protein [unclassified Agrococcus]|uniref:SipW-dependent-type signal peptide-containing protein n=1 Tax=unclassified Agrococcus TaxID=2615065 RepID=UPI003622EEB5
MALHRAPRANRRLGLKIRAILAGGLALGVGATVTLAAWNDSEYATTTVTASTFNIVGNMSGQTGGTAFTEHDTTASAGVVTYSPAVTGMSPNTVSYGTVQIQTTAATNVGGSVIVQQSGAAPATPLAGALRYAIRVAPNQAACAEALFTSTTPPAGSVIVPNATPFSTGIVTAGQTTQSLSAAAGNTVTYCVRIELPAGAPSTLQGGTATATWQFLATSSS